MGNRYILIGIPDAGKTSFIAALFHLSESREIPESLQLVELGETRDYLVSIRDRWIACEEVGRTNLGEEHIVTLKVEDKLTREVADLILPDVSGETFTVQWEKRKSTVVFDQIARQATGALMFVHPDSVNESVRINEIRALANEIKTSDESSYAGPIEARPSAEAPTPWHPRFTETQVQMVEFLQFLLRDPSTYPLSRIAVVISAWDLVSKHGNTPSEWLWSRLPLLAQFLSANPELFTFKIFGVSALGGPLSEDTDKLLSLKRSSERIQVHTDTADEFFQHDISAPIKWLMAADR